MINVNGSDDDFYRYKMPAVEVKNEGSGYLNTKTVLLNLDDIGKAIARPAKVIAKFLAVELGVSAGGGKGGQPHHLKGMFAADDLQLKLIGFIAQFVLCGVCGDPGTCCGATPDDALALNCKACGNTTRVRSGHKITRDLLRVAAADDSNQKKKGKKTKKGRRWQLDADEQHGGDNAVQATAPNANGGWVSDLTAGSPAPACNASNTGNTSTAGVDGCDESGWSSSEEDLFSPEAVRARQQGLGAGAARLAATADLELSQEERAEVFKRFVAARLGAVGAAAADWRPVIEEAERLSCRVPAAGLVLEQVFSNAADRDPVATLATVTPGLALLVGGKSKARLRVLGAAEQAILDCPGTLLPKTVRVLNGLFEGNVCGATEIQLWAESASPAVRDRAAPFLDWIAEGDRSGSDDDDTDAPDHDGGAVGGVDHGRTNRHGSVDDDDDPFASDAAATVAAVAAKEKNDLDALIDSI